MIITLTGNCVVCGRPFEITVFEDDFEAWQNGALVQDVFWYLTSDERELLISGICEICWTKMFGE